MRGALMALVLLVGCDQVPPGDPLEAARPGARAVATSSGSGTGGFDFDGEDRKDEQDQAPSDADPLAIQAGLFGLDPDAVKAPAPATEPAPAPAATPVAAVAGGVPMPQWLPGQPLDGTFGVRVISTLNDLQPPRAVIATANGQELVVQPGQMLPEHRMIVLAIGQGAVQLAHITPQGFYARVDTETIAALASGPTGAAPSGR